MLLITEVAPSVKAMEFYIAATGGNCTTCTWIAADGTINPDTHSRFIKFLADNDLLDKSGLNIHLNSPGGDLLGGIRLGYAIRRQKANTVISNARKSEIYSDGMVIVGESLPSECSSACAFAFAGGVSRFASGTTIKREVGFQKIGKLGVNQFYDQRSLGSLSEQLFTTADRIVDQKIIAILLRYLSDVDVSAELLQLASNTPPNTMYYLTEEDLLSTEIDNQMVQEVFIKGYKNGVGVTEIRYQRQDGDYRLELFCHNGKMRMLASLQFRGAYDISGHTRWHIFDSLTLEDGTPVTVVSEKFHTRTDNGITLGPVYILRNHILTAAMCKNPR